VGRRAADADAEARWAGEQLDRRERKNVFERRVVEAVRLGDCLVRDLPVEDVDAMPQ
jgi:hypothetical protein